jgi:Ser/Thr protein kinase RdoA (MazF antagonist)
MEKRIKERYNDSILQQVMGSYAIQGSDIHLLDGFESFIYEFERDSASYILRVGHSLRRNENLIRGEVDWINYLHQGGASVSKAILTVNGDLVAAVDDESGGLFLATAFEKAAGEPPGEKQWGKNLYEHYGRLIGRMHALTKDYQPADPAWRRPEWDHPEFFEIDWLPESESIAVRKYHELRTHFDTLSKSRDSYGLIHQDAHAGNFFVDQQGIITLFDFDDCCYSWFINDIAIVLFYIALGAESKAAFAKEFMTHFLHGYRSENHLDQKWLGEIPSFLKLREIDLYAVIHRSFDVENLDHPWVAMFMKDRKERIEKEVPVIDFDFITL